jgi:hypothetical protein
MWRSCVSAIVPSGSAGKTSMLGSQVSTATIVRRTECDWITSRRIYIGSSTRTCCTLVPDFTTDPPQGLGSGRETTADRSLQRRRLLYAHDCRSRAPGRRSKADVRPAVVVAAWMRAAGGKLPFPIRGASDASAPTSGRLAGTGELRWSGSSYGGSRQAGVDKL